MPWVEVQGVPSWVPHRRLLDDGDWELTDGRWVGRRSAREAADLQARLRNLGMGGHPLVVDVRPSLKRTVIRAARSDDARRQRDTTPGFTRSGTRLDDDGRLFLTPEVLALELGERAVRAGYHNIVDGTCGCGGNAIGFARAGCQVRALDTSPTRLAHAVHNASRYGVADRIRFERADLRQALPHLEADLLFLDPPWGEVDRIHCRTLPLLDDALATDRTLWVKAPPSFFHPAFDHQAVFGRASGDRQRVKFVLAIRTATD